MNHIIFLFYKGRYAGNTVSLGYFEKGPDGPFSEVDYAGTTLLACGPF